VTVLLRAAGTADHLPPVPTRARTSSALRGALAAGSGVLGRLVDAAAAWAADRGADQLTLDVHVDNHRARAPTQTRLRCDGETFTSVIGPEMIMVRPG
jgi:hypothetical protein